MFARCFFLGPCCGLTRWMRRVIILVKFATSLNFYTMVCARSCHWKFSLCSLQMFFWSLISRVLNPTDLSQNLGQHVSVTVSQDTEGTVFAQPATSRNENQVQTEEDQGWCMRFLNNVPIFVIRQTIFTLMACSNNVDLETWRTVKQQGSLFCCTRVIHSCGFLSGSN